MILMIFMPVLEVLNLKYGQMCKMMHMYCIAGFPSCFGHDMSAWIPRKTHIYWSIIYIVIMSMHRSQEKTIFVGQSSNVYLCISLYQSIRKSIGLVT